MKRSALVFRLLLPAGGFALGWLACSAVRPAPAFPPPTASAKALPPALLTSTPAAASASPETPVALLQARRLETAYAEAARDLPAALARLDSVKDYTERRALILGIFSWLAKNRPPAEAMRLAMQQNASYRQIALGAMVQQWAGHAEPPANVENFTQNASVALFYSKNTPRAAADAWLAAFADDPGRADIALHYAGAYLIGSPDKLLPMAASFTPWEREHFLGGTLAGWGAQGEKESGESMAWMKEHWDQIPPSSRARALSGWAAGSPEKALTELEATTDPVRRNAMIPALASVLGAADTAKAVAWADSLPTPAEQESANAAIYDAVPRGIGVQFHIAEGFPYVQGVMPDGPAAKAGLVTGDRLVSVASGDAAPLSL